MNTPQTAPNGQTQLIGQEEGGFRLVSPVLPPPKPSRAELETAARARLAHLSRMGDLFNLNPEPTR